ncbi:Hypothetical predicted protein [Mytilus galloprovincialis]|uniref:Uncharacterized protein n=1 Tax=Mytilus galloprovincialis TaxID=29158 RepID=A0A8B6GFM3_MYTGA|nr:Hypothetical predicted protein [Mytilus galloprovincialis]
MDQRSQPPPNSLAITTACCRPDQGIVRDISHDIRTDQECVKCLFMADVMGMQTTTLTLMSAR